MCTIYRDATRYDIKLSTMSGHLHDFLMIHKYTQDYLKKTCKTDSRPSNLTNLNIFIFFYPDLKI